MKILAQNWRDIKNPEAGGAEVHLYEILKRLAANGHHITWVASRFKGGSKSDEVDDMEIIRVGSKFNFNFVFFIHYFFRFRKREFDVIVDDVSKVPLCIHLYAKTPTVAIIHHIHGKSVFDELPCTMAIYVYVLEKFLLSWFYRGQLPKTIITVSESTRKELMDFGIRDRIRIVHNGVNLDLMCSQVNTSKASYPLILYLGRVKRYKRLDHVLRMFKRVKDRVPLAHLVIAGKGDNYGELEELVDELGLNSVDLKGPLSEEKKAELLKKAWVYVITSKKEGWGIGVIEANACGVPVLGYNVPGLRDSIRNGYNGFLVEEGNVEKLAEKVILLLTNPKLRRKLSHNSKKWARKFSWDESAKEFERILEGVVWEEKQSSW